MPNFVITPAQLEAIQKSALSIVGDDQEKQDLLAKSFEQLQETLVVKAATDPEDEADGGDDEEEEGDSGDKSSGVQKVLLGLYSEISKSLKKGSEGAVQEAFEKAFGTMTADVDALVESAFDAGEKIAKAGKSGDAGGDGEDGDGDEDDQQMSKVLKSMPASVRKRFETLNQQNTDLAKRIDALQTERDVEKFAKIAKDIGQPAAFGETLRKLQKIDKDAYEAVVKELKAKNEAIRKGDLFSEIGKGGVDTEATALDKLNAHADEIIGKSTTKISKAKAFSQACTDHPDLYKEYRRGR